MTQIALTINKYPEIYLGNRKQQETLLLHFTGQKSKQKWSSLIVLSIHGCICTSAPPLVLQRLQARTQESPGPEVCSDCSVRGAGRGCAAAVCSLTARDKYAAPPLLRPVCPRHPSPPCCPPCCCSPPPSSPRPRPPRSTPTPRPRTERTGAAWTRPSAASPRSSGTPMCTL